MKNKKGFTLIELLAVIVILAIIALIATPLVLKYIDKAREGAKERSAESYIRAAETEIVANLLRDNTSLNTTCNVKSNGNLDCDGKEVTVSVKGTKPTGGYVTFDGKKVTNASLLYEDGNNINIDSNGNVTQSSNYKEAILYGADPVLKGELIPVIIESNGTVKKADITKEWYNYTNKEWANAVILFDEDNYKAGDEIDESAIKEYYVWIPKYSYRLWNVNSDNTNNVGKPIEIVFGSKATTTGENNGDMYLHPAFTNFNTQGIWVGKFETSYNEETFTDSTTFLTTNPNTSSTTEASNLIIKPNVRSLSNKNVSSLHTLLFNSHRDLNSHMMTNMEWGATAYLTYSIYGRCTSETCTEVTINNVNNGYLGATAKFTGQWQYGTTITGCAANSVSETYVSNADKCVNNYNSEKGYLASTTGNITGIYDMSGGTWEYVMGVLVQPDGTLFSGRHSTYNSGFKGIYGCPTCDSNTSGLTENTIGIDLPNEKYYNTYKNNNALSTDIWYDYSQGLLGDATKEIANTKANASSGDSGNWFNDYAYFATPTYPWFRRGGHYANGSGAGVFYFARYGGGAGSSGSARLVLAY